MLGDKDFHTGSLSPTEAARQRRIRSASRFADEENNPCLKESRQSLSCMNDNDFDREKCSLYFINYRNCLNFWKRVRADRQSQGIKPYLPLPEDRETIRNEYYKKWAYSKD